MEREISVMKVKLTRSSVSFFVVYTHTLVQKRNKLAEIFDKETAVRTSKGKTTSPPLTAGTSPVAPFALLNSVVLASWPSFPREMGKTKYYLNI
jgi:hypothetical protein